MGAASRTRLPAMLDQYRGALIAVGHSNRTADVFGMLLALADLMLSDGDVDSDSAAELAVQLEIAILPEAKDSASGEQEWLDFVLSSTLPADGPADDRTTVAEWLRRASEPFNALADKGD